MKTILYQPLFINPQAYFVFPQLYHIEKGDSYIEPANITGQLIINDLTQSLTSTPILNVVQDTNQVDFGLFKGKHIRISQYTNIGAVVLGERYIPGIPIPPEPEQPDWFKESIVAWYSPYCKQNMTNYDVIESYADDFTKWRIESTGVTSTQKKIVIAAGTELKYNVAYKGFGNSIAEFDIKYIGSAVIRYHYNKEDGTTGIITINRSGIYHLPASIKAQKNFGFYCNPQTVTEEATIEQLPTSILKDFSGNGNHAYLYGGKGKLNSGMGVYQQDFSKLIISRVDKKQDPFSFTVSGSGGSYLAYMQLGNWNNKAFKISANINAEGDYLYLRFRNNTDAVITSVLLKNGENIIPAQNIEGATKAVFEYSLKEGGTITITQIPDYPDQLCYDGNMYAVCYGFPILTDYTVMAERTILDNSDIADWAFIAKRDYPAINGAFTFEKDIDDTSDNLRTISFGRTSVIYKPIKERSISYQTKNKYNGQDIIVGNVDDVDFLLIGAGILDTNLNLVKEKMRVAHGNILLFNRSLTEYEISWVKNNMMCSKQQEPDIDL